MLELSQCGASLDLCQSASLETNVVTYVISLQLVSLDGPYEGTAMVQDL